MEIVILDAIRDGLSALRADNGILLIAAISTIIPYGVMAMLFLYKLEVTSEPVALMSGGLCGGLLFDSLASFVVLWVLPVEWALYYFVSFAAVVWGVDILLWRRWRLKIRLDRSFWGLAVFLPVLLIFKLAFIANLHVPLYTDSVEHYAIIQDFTNPQAEPRSYYTPDSFPEVIYHYGYHSLVAKQYVLTQANLGRIMLVFGQLVLTAGAIGIYFPIFLLTESGLAGWAAVLTASFVWLMPSYAINWGKYPAITAYSLFPFVLGLIIFILQKRKAPAPKQIYFFLGISVLAITLIHMRMAVILVLLFACTGWVFRMKCQPKVLLTINLLILTMLCAFLISQVNFAASYFDIFWRYGQHTLLVALFSSIYAAIKMPRTTLVCLLLLCLSFLTASLGLPEGFERYTAAIDRPFFQIGTYFFAAMMLAISLSELGKLDIRRAESPIIPVLILVLGLILISIAPLAEILAPSTCCYWVDEEDLFAYHWLESNTSITDRVLIAASSQQFDMRPTDGGAWIKNLANRSTVEMDYGFDFDLFAAPENLDQLNVRYIYVDNQTQSFRAYGLLNNPDWYVAVLRSPSVQIFEVLTSDNHH